MTLPHPNGDTTAGDMFFPGSPTVTVSDAAGPGGSRAVEFGEDGTSAAVNRGLLALAKNDEYLDARIEAKMARPEFTSFVPSGGNGDSFTFSSVDLWVGDATYLPETQAIRDQLISVLDANFNDLLDSAGNKVVIRELKNSGDTNSIVGDQLGAGGDEDGFYNAGAIVRFQTVNPVTGSVVIANYTIPDATGVVFAHGVSGTIESLATVGQESLMRDAFVKGAIRTASEIHAAVFLKDGSRKAIASFDMDGFDLNNVGTITNKATANLDLVSSEEINFDDKWLTAAVPLAESGVTGLVGGLNSVLGELNSKTDITIAFHGDRIRDRNGVIVFTGATGNIAWPELRYMRDGESKTVAASNITVTAGSDAMLVIDSTGTVVERIGAAIVSADIPIASYNWDGVSAFNFGLDIRWPTRKRSGVMEITCGSAFGSDFSTLQLQEAVEAAIRHRLADGTHGRSVVRIVGTADMNGQKTLTLRGPVSIVGDGVNRSTIKSDENDNTVDFIDCAGNQLIMSGLTLMNSSNNLADTLAAIKNAGDGSIFRDLVIDKDPGTFDVGFSNVWLWTQAAERIVVSDIDVRCNPTHALILGATDIPFTTSHVTRSVVRNVDISGWGVGASVGIALPGEGCQIYNVTIPSGLDDYSFVIGNDSVLADSRCRMTGAAGVIRGVYYKPVTAPTFRSGALIRDCFFLRIAGSGIWMDTNDVNVVAHLKIRGCEFLQVDEPFDFGDITNINSASHVSILENRIQDTVEFVLHNVKLQKVYFSKNSCFVTGGAAIVFDSADAGGFIEDNFFEGYGNLHPTHKHLMEIGIGVPDVFIRGNVCGGVGAPAASIQIDIWRSCTIANNHLNIGTATVNRGIMLNGAAELGARACTISGNAFLFHDEAAIWSDATSHSHRIVGNRFAEHPNGAVGVRLAGSCCCLVDSNTFEAQDPGVGPKYDATPVYITDTTSTNGRSNRISNNVMRWVRGLTQKSVIRVNQTLGGGEFNTISGNQMLNCGDETAAVASDTQALIRVNAEANLIDGNYMFGIFGVNTADTGIFIDVTAISCQIYGNHIFKDITGASWAANPATMIGIRVNVGAVDAFAVCVGNSVNFTGTNSAGAGVVITGIDLGAGERIICCNNLFRDWDATGSTQTTILSSGNLITVLGNISKTRGANITGATSPSNTAQNLNGVSTRVETNELIGFV